MPSIPWSRVLLLTGWFLVVGTLAADRPNVLFIAVDDLNDWVGCLGGHPQGATPNIDRLASSGHLFARAYCAAPGCNASRTSLLFGVSPSTSGVFNNGDSWRESPALTGRPSLPAFLRLHGWKTLRGGKIFHAHTFTEAALVGSSQPEAWDVGFPSLQQQLPEEIVPEKRPVVTTRESFYGGCFDWAPLDGAENSMGDTRVADWAISQLRQDHDRPFFLAVGIYRPHVPWYVPRPYFNEFPRKTVLLPETLATDLEDVPDPARKWVRESWHEWLIERDLWPDAIQAYLASMKYADEQIGRILRALDSSAHAQNTIVILWSDHGYHLGEKRHWEKFALWEDTTHVPLIFRVPGRTRAGSTTREPVSLLDIYPTLVGLLGLPVERYLEGIDLVPFFAAPAVSRDTTAVSTQGRDNHALRTDRFRYIRYADGREELYDHQVDPNEWHNLAADSKTSQTKTALAARLDAELARHAVRAADTIDRRAVP